MSVSVGSTAWMAPGQYLFVSGGGFYSVSSITNGTTVVLSNLGGPDNAAPAASITSPKAVAAAGAPSCIVGAVTTLSGGSGGAPLSTGATTEYSSLVFGVNPNTTQANGYAIVRCGGTLSNFSVTLSAAAGVSPDAYTFTVMTGGGITATSIACTITGTGTTCTDTSAPTSVVLAAGTVVNVAIASTNSPNGPTATWTATYTNDGTAFSSPIQ